MSNLEPNPGSELPELERAPKPTRLIETVLPLSLIGAILFLFLFSWLAHEVFEGATVRFDSAIRGWVHQFASPDLTRAMFAISWMGARRSAAPFSNVDRRLSSLSMAPGCTLAFLERGRSRCAHPYTEVRLSPSAPHRFLRCRPNLLQLPQRTLACIVLLLPGTRRSAQFASAVDWSSHRHLDRSQPAGRGHRTLARLSRCALSQRCHRWLSRRGCLGHHPSRRRSHARTSPIPAQRRKSLIQAGPPPWVIRHSLAVRRPISSVHA